MIMDFSHFNEIDDEAIINFIENNEIALYEASNGTNFLIKDVDIAKAVAVTPVNVKAYIFSPKSLDAQLPAVTTAGNFILECKNIKNCDEFINQVRKYQLGDEDIHVEIVSARQAELYEVY